MIRNRNCRHGFNPWDGPGLWCPACDAVRTEASWWRRAWRRLTDHVMA